MSTIAGLEDTAGVATYVAAGEPASFNAAGYAALDWTKVVGVVSFGEWGDSEQDLSEPLLEDQRIIHANGVKDGGTCQISIQYRTTDAGADIIKTYAGSNDPVSVMKVYKGGEGECSCGVFTTPRQRAATGQTVRGYTTDLRVNAAVVEMSTSDVTTALA